MQSKIRVYESGRSEQEFDPDLPPELMAAASMQESLGDVGLSQQRLPDSTPPTGGTGRGRGAGRGRITMVSSSILPHLIFSLSPPLFLIFLLLS
jgi:hypothetical protein